MELVLFRNCHKMTNKFPCPVSHSVLFSTFLPLRMLSWGATSASKTVPQLLWESRPGAQLWMNSEEAWGLLLRFKLAITTLSFNKERLIDFFFSSHFYSWNATKLANSVPHLDSVQVNETFIWSSARKSWLLLVHSFLRDHQTLS
jgi:hypothetical protein